MAIMVHLVISANEALARVVEVIARIRIGGRF